MKAANDLSNLANQLTANSIEDKRVIHQFDNEARALIRAVGGGAPNPGS